MPRISHIIKRNATYYARLRVPVDLVDRVRKKELVESLKTTVAAEARRRVHVKIAAWNSWFDDLRRQSKPSEEDIEEAIWSHYTQSLMRDELERTLLPDGNTIASKFSEIVSKAQACGLDPKDDLAVLNFTLEYQYMKDATKGPNSLMSRTREVRLQELRSHLSRGETALVNHEVEYFLEKGGYSSSLEENVRKNIAMRFLRAEIEIVKRALERDSGNYGGGAVDPILAGARADKSVEAPAKGPSIMEAFETYAKENPRGVRADTLNQARRDISLFVGSVGSDATVAAIDKSQIRKWKALLLKYPVKAAESVIFRGMTMQQIVEANEAAVKPTISTRTVNRHLSSLSAFCLWCMHNGYLDTNPVENMALSKETHAKRQTFTSDMLNLLFSSPLYAGCENADTWKGLRNPGGCLVRDHRYWVPLVMMFSGARPAEIAQLEVADIRAEGGTWIMHITPEGNTEKYVKTEGSARILPLHPQLVRLGFLDYWKQAKVNNQLRLFPSAIRNARGQMMADFSREFPRYLAHIGMRDTKGLSLYSFRHGAADELRRAGFLDDQFGFLLGHSKATTTGRYGRIPQGVLERRVQLINAIDYPGVDFDLLLPKN